jgi:hypothetical protein
MVNSQSIVDRQKKKKKSSRQTPLDINPDDPDWQGIKPIQILVNKTQETVKDEKSISNQVHVSFAAKKKQKPVSQ